MEEIIIKEIDARATEYPQLVAFRNRMLRVPLGLNIYEEDLSDDQKDIILIVSQGEEIVGCVMLHPLEENVVKLRQMAIAEKLQGKGIGKVLVEDAEQAAAEYGFNKIILHARVHVQGFYEQLGYQPYGEIFTEVTIPHIAMEKQLG